MNDEQLHAYARERAALLADPDKKQLRFNDIVRAAKAFYPTALVEGVREMVDACDRADPALYAKDKPMWQSLEQGYGWVLQ